MPGLRHAWFAVGGITQGGGSGGAGIVGSRHERGVQAFFGKGEPDAGVDEVAPGLVPEMDAGGKGDGMKVMISVDHPAWAHQFHHIIEKLQARGDEVLVLAIDKDGAPELLRRYGIPYSLCAKGTGRNIVEKGWLFLRLCVLHLIA